MRGQLLVPFVLAAITATADAKDYTVEVPAGWVEADASVAAAQFEGLRAVRGMKSLESAIYLSPDETTQLSVLRFTLTLDAGASKAQLRAFDNGMTNGAAKKATRHVSDHQQWVGTRFLTSSVDETEVGQVKQARNYAVDSHGQIQALIVICAGAPEAFGACEAAQRSMKLDVADEVVPTDEPPRDLAYEIGRITGFAAVAVLIAWLIRRSRKKAS